MKKIKNLLVLAMTLCMTVGLLITPAHANETDPDDIMNYVIGGSGTEDDPYILTSDNPYKEKFDTMAKEAVQPTIMPLVDFSGTLTGTKYYNQNSGGSWQYGGGGPGLDINNALVILNITYNTPYHAENLNDVMNNGTWKSWLLDSLIEGFSDEALLSSLMSKGLAYDLAFSCKTIITFGYITDITNAADSQTVRTAANNGQGILAINYRTSYNGSWFYTSTLDIWRDYPTASTPGSYYGSGRYSSL